MALGNLGGGKMPVLYPWNFVFGKLKWSSIIKGKKLACLREKLFLLPQN